MGKSTDQRSTLNSLTGLRFLAASIVVCYHVSRYLLPELQGVAGLGYVGVTFFFVLSGFLLSWSQKPESKRKFYWKRFARIYPLFLLTTFVAGAFIFVTGQTPSIPKLIPVLLLVHAWIPPGDWHYAYNGVSWSLSDEAFFYFLFPLITPIIRRLSTRWMVILGCAVGVLLVALSIAVVSVLPEQTWGALLYVNPAYRLGEFLVGVLLGVGFTRGWRPTVKLRSGAAAAMVLLVLDYCIAHFAYGDVLQMPFAFGNLVILPGVVALVIGAANSDLDGSATWLASRPLVLLGEWSFALYLVHELALRGGEVVFEQSDLPTRVFAAIAAVVLSVAIAGALYSWYERPVEKWLRNAVGMASRPEIPDVSGK